MAKNIPHIIALSLHYPWIPITRFWSVREVVCFPIACHIYLVVHIFWRFLWSWTPTIQQLCHATVLYCHKLLSELFASRTPRPIREGPGIHSLCNEYHQSSQITTMKYDFYHEYHLCQEHSQACSLTIDWTNDPQEFNHPPDIWEWILACFPTIFA